MPNTETQQAHTITIYGVEYSPAAEPAETRIVVLQRGWVVVGRWQRDGVDVTITDAKVIRRWGTLGKGLGELRSGPTSETLTDEAGTVRCHVLTIVLTLDCEAGSWA